MAWSWPSLAVFWSCRKTAQTEAGARFSQWPGEVRAGRQQRAGPEPSLRLARFRDVLAAGRVHPETGTSKEHVDRGTNLVHKCVGELTAAGHGCALGSTLNPQKAGERPGLQQGGDVLNETCDATLVIWVGAISKCESFQNKLKAALCVGKTSLKLPRVTTSAEGGSGAAGDGGAGSWEPAVDSYHVFEGFTESPSPNPSRGG